LTAIAPGGDAADSRYWKSLDFEAKSVGTEIWKPGWSLPPSWPAIGGPFYNSSGGYRLASDIPSRVEPLFHPPGTYELGFGLAPGPIVAAEEEELRTRQYDRSRFWRRLVTTEVRAELNERILIRVHLPPGLLDQVLAATDRQAVDRLMLTSKFEFEIIRGEGWPAKAASP
jgi:hypothetical protein